jgi:hypothetical protein
MRLIGLVVVPVVSLLLAPLAVEAQRQAGKVPAFSALAAPLGVAERRVEMMLAGFVILVCGLAALATA